MIAYVFTLNDVYCGYRRDETPVFRAMPGAPYATLEVTVTEKLTHTDEDCGEGKIPAAYVRTYRGVYRWNAVRGDFAVQGDLGKLDKINGARF